MASASHFIGRRVAFGVMGVSARQRRWILGAALLISQLPAHADLWGYVDESGVTHFAASQTDERFQLFFKGNESAGLSALAGGAAGAGSRAKAKPVAKAAAAAEPAGAKFELPKRFVRLDSSSSYKLAQKHMRAAAKAYQIDYELIKAVIAAESGFDAAAVSPKGAVGLMQLMPSTAEQYGVQADKSERRDKKGNVLAARTIEEKLTDPQINVNAGARYLAYLTKLFKGELELAIAAYNAGEGAVQRAGNKVPKYKETQGYVKTVLGLYSVFKPSAPLAAGGTAASMATSGDGAARGAAPAALASGRAGGRVRVELAAAKRAPAAAAVAAGPTSTATAATAIAKVPVASDGQAADAASALVSVRYLVPPAVGDVERPSLASDVRIDGRPPAPRAEAARTDPPARPELRAEVATRQARSD